MKPYFVLFFYIIFISSCDINQQYQPVRIEEKCYPPLFIAVFIDEDSSNTNRDADLKKINNLPEDLSLSSSLLLFAVNTEIGKAQVDRGSDRIKKIIVEPKANGQKGTLDKELNEFLDKNNICRECDRDFYMYIVIDKSGSMIAGGGVPDVDPWINKVKAAYTGLHVICAKGDATEQWCRWILDGVAAYQDLMP